MRLQKSDLSNPTAAARVMRRSKAMIKDLLFTKRAKATVSETSLHAAEIELGFSLPRAFVEFCQTHNGGIPADQNRFYTVPNSYREFHQEYRSSDAGVFVEGLFGLTGDFKRCDCLRACKQLREPSRIVLFPIAYDLFGSHVVVLSEEPERTVFWVDHELWIGPEEPMLFPTLIVEVLSDSSAAYDRGQKLEFYRQLPSLREYLLVSQMQPHIEDYARQDNGAWLLREVAGLEGCLDLPSLSISISLSEVYSKVRFVATPRHPGKPSDQRS